MGSSERSSRVFRSSPFGWYFAALFPIGIGAFMYAVEASEWKRLRLSDPVAATGEFTNAECITHRRGRMSERERMTITYAFAAAGYKTPEEEADGMPRPASIFTATDSIAYSSRDACEAALPAVQRARAPHPVWFERNQPHSTKMTLQEPDSTRFLWLSLGAVPLLAVGAMVQWRRRRAA